MIHYSEVFYGSSALSSLPLIATFIFFAVFVGVLVYVMLEPGRFQRLSQLPFDDEQPITNRAPLDEVGHV